jgi:SAM-dependent methyltransferase
VTLAPAASPGALEALGDATLAKLRERTAASGYDAKTVGDCESLIRIPVEAVRLPLIRWTLRRRGDPAAVLARLWAYDDVTPVAAVRAALGDGVFDALLGAGLLVERDGETNGTRGVSATCRLLPFEGMWLACDPPDLGADAVMGPGGTTLETACLMPRAIAGAALDVGCGAGSLALVAARRGASPSCGVDLNPRAIAMARFNARLNAVSATFEAGDLFEPVNDRAFDFVVAQPPYVIEPPGTPHVTFLHGGERGDAVTARLLKELPAHLSPGGVALVLIDAPIGGGVPVHERSRAMLADAALDLCVVVAPGLSPELQSAAYAMVEDTALGSRYAAAATRYREHLARLGIREVRHVALIARRPSAPRGVAGFTLSLPVGSLPHRSGRRTDELLAAIDHAAFPDDALLACAVKASRHARFIQTRERPRLEEEGDYRVRFEPGALAVDQELSAASLLLLELLERAPSVDAAADAYAERCSEPPGAMRAAVLEFVRRGLTSGLLVPADGVPTSAS